MSYRVTQKLTEANGSIDIIFRQTCVALIVAAALFALFMSLQAKITCAPCSAKALDVSKPIKNKIMVLCESKY